MKEFELICKETIERLDNLIYDLCLNHDYSEVDLFIKRLEQIRKIKQVIKENER